MLDLVFRGAIIGVGATILMDIWAIMLAAATRQARPNWAPIGRWFHHLGKGRVFHPDIALAEPFAFELALGWIGHYAVGILYGIVLVLIMGQQWLAQPTFLPAWIMGIVTVGAGWFLLQPGIGIGWAASKTPNPNKVRLLNFLGHTVFGAGLYLTALLIR